MQATPTQPYSSDEIQSCAQVIARAMKVEEVWLFGSVARGDADEGSDVDLLVVLPNGHTSEWPAYDAKLALSRAGTSIPTDVIAITAAQKRRPPSPVIEDALREGKRLL